MTSPVDTSVKFFTSQMAGAPVLSGTVGSMIGLLDAVLKDGFGTVALTSLVVSGGVATAAYAGTHAAQEDAVVLIEGVTGSLVALNGEQKIVSKPGTTSVTFATAAPDGAATGAITMKMAPLGWLKSFAGTNKAAYKSASPMSTGCLLRVDDTATTVARVVGYESMTDVDTGLGPFPTPAQQTGGGYWFKSSVANANANAWVIAGDARFILIFVAPYFHSNASFVNGYTRGFGDPIALRPSGDAYLCVLNYCPSSTVGDSYLGAFDVPTSTVSTATPRSHTGLGSGVLNTTQPYTGGANALSGNDGTLGSFPSVVDASLKLSRRYVCPSLNSAPRGDLPGLLTVPQAAAVDSFKTFDKTSGSGSLSGKRLLALTPSTALAAPPTSAGSGASFVDITGPWR